MPIMKALLCIGVNPFLAQLNPVKMSRGCVDRALPHKHKDPAF